MRRLDPRTTILAAALMAFAMWPGAALAAPPKLDKALTHAVEAAATGAVDVIVTFAPGHFDAVHATLAAKHRSVTADHPSIHALSATVDVSDLPALASEPAVVAISLDATCGSLGEDDRGRGP